MLYFLKTEMRKQVTPGISRIITAPGGKAILAYVDGTLEEVQQFIVKTTKGELIVVEMDCRSKDIRRAYFVKLATQSQRLSFGMYRTQADCTLATAELDALIENVLSNLRNEPLVRKTNQAFDTVLINHIKGDKKFTIDPYDDELLKSDLKVDELLVERRKDFLTVKNSPTESSQAAKTLSFLTEDPVKQKASKLENGLPLARPLILQTEDNTAAFQQQVEKINRLTEVIHPEDDPSNYGLKKGSVKPEVYAAYQKKLTELLNNVYLDEKVWSLAEETGGLKLWTQDHSHYVIQRSEIDLSYPLETVKNYICDASFRYKYDSLLKSLEIVETMSDQVAILRVVVKGSFPVSDRDFVTCRMMFYQNHDVSLSQPDFRVHELHARLLQLPGTARHCARRLGTARHHLDAGR